MQYDRGVLTKAYFVLLFSSGLFRRRQDFWFQPKSWRSWNSSTRIYRLTSYQESIDLRIHTLENPHQYPEGRSPEGWGVDFPRYEFLGRWIHIPIRYKRRISLMKISQNNSLILILMFCFASFWVSHDLTEKTLMKKLKFSRVCRLFNPCNLEL